MAQFIFWLLLGIIIVAVLLKAFHPEFFETKVAVILRRARVPKGENAKTFPFRFTWNGVDPLDNLVYNPIGKAFRDNCVEALKSLNDEIVQVNGEVSIEVIVPELSDMQMDVRLTNIDHDLQDRIIVVLPRSLPDATKHSGYGRGSRGGLYHISSSGRKTYVRKR
jgi:hypothetical protein